MNTKELIKNVQPKLEDYLEVKLNLDQTREILNIILSTIEEGLLNEQKVDLIGFGNYEVKLRSERKGRNPSTGEPMIIPSQFVVKFKVAKRLKDKLNS